MSKLYLAARYSRRDELAKYKITLEERGHSVPARWLDGEDQTEALEVTGSAFDDGPTPIEAANRYANIDVEDIIASDTLICFTEPARMPSATRGGRHVEVGIFLGLKWTTRNGEPPRRLYSVGPIENIFYSLGDFDGRFHDFDRLLAALDAGRIQL